jgi:glycosyltransferase involved in cell wall biosynthesis
MKQPPTVSVGLPVFNGEPFIAEAIDSILAQTFEDFELVISDNASTDRTQEICLAYAEKDDRVRYVRNRDNLGAAYNYNQTFHLSSGRYFKWAAHDDVMLPDFLERCVVALDGDPSVVVSYARWATIDEAGHPLESAYPIWRGGSPDPVERFRLTLLTEGRTQTPIFGLFRSDVLRDTGLHRPIPSGDCVLLAEVSLYGPFREIPKELFVHREHAGRSVTIPSFRDRVNWWRPVSGAGRFGRGSVDALLLFAWTRALVAAGYAESIRRSPLTPWAKLRCYAYLPVWAADQFRLRLERRLPRRS